MNVVHVIIGLNNGGAENFLYRLVRCQSNNGKKITIISLTDLGSLGARFIDLGVVVHCLYFQGLHSVPRVLIDLRRILKNISPDIVQSWMYHADFLSSLATLGLKFKHIWSVRCTNPPKGSRLTFLIMKLCAKMSKFFPDRICYVATSAMLSHENHGFCSAKSVVISNGYDFSTFKVDYKARAEIRENLDVSADTLLFGVLGRFHYDKGQDLLLKALSTIGMKNFKLALIGFGCSKENAGLLKNIESLGLKDNVILLGNQSDVVGYLSSLDFYIMPSRTEGFPNALAEAMAMGLPCVATNVGDTEMLCKDTAILCEASADSIADSILKMKSLSEAEQKDLGFAAAAHVRERFSITNIEKQYSQLYSELVGS